MKNMSSSMRIARLFVVLFLFQCTIISARRIDILQSQTISNYDHEPDFDGVHNQRNQRRRPMEIMMRRRADTLDIAGSRLPDCSHACGSCSPCRLVIVGFACASLSEAETCPISYRCMCNNKYYPIP